jgi:hypothetical protein
MKGMGALDSVPSLVVSHFLYNKNIGNWTLLFFFLFSLFPFIYFPGFLVPISEMSRKFANPEVSTH